MSFLYSGRLSPGQVQALRAVPGVRVRWNRVEYPPDCRWILEGLGLRLDPMPLAVRPLVKRPEEVRGWERFRPFQRVGVPLLAEGRVKILNWVGGSGKSAAYLAATELRGARKTLVTTRAIGVGSFLRDARWCSSLHVEPVSGRGPDFQVEAAYECADVIVVPYSVLAARAQALGALRWDLFVNDESHYLRSYKHKGYAVWVQAAEQLADGIVARDGDVWQGSGTPIRDRRRDLWRQLRILFPDLRFGTGWWFGVRYCEGHIDEEWGGFVNTGESNTDELKRRLAFYTHRVEKAELQQYLPALKFTVVRLEGGARGRTVRARESAYARASKVKIPVAAELAADTLIEGGKVVVTVMRKRDLEPVLVAIRKETGSRDYPVFLTSGEHHDPLERRKLCDRFLAIRSGAVLLVCTLDSVGEAVDLQTTDRVIAVALPWTAGQVEQFVARFARQGQDRPCEVVWLVGTGTVDDIIYDKLLSKLRDSESLGVSTSSRMSSLFDGAPLPTDEEMRKSVAAWLETVAAADPLDLEVGGASYVGGGAE